MNKIILFLCLIALQPSSLFCPKAQESLEESFQGSPVPRDILLRDHFLEQFHNLYFYKFCFRTEKEEDPCFETLVFSTNIDLNCTGLTKCAYKGCSEDSLENDSDVAIPFCQEHFQAPFNKEYPEWTNEKLFNYWKTRIINPIKSFKGLKPYLENKYSEFYKPCQILYQSLDRYFKACVYQAKIERMKLIGIEGLNKQVIQLLKTMAETSKNQNLEPFSEIPDEERPPFVTAIENTKTHFFTFEPTPIKVKPLRRKIVAAIMELRRAKDDASAAEPTPAASRRQESRQSSRSSMSRSSSGSQKRSRRVLPAITTGSAVAAAA